MHICTRMKPQSREKKVECSQNWQNCMESSPLEVPYFRENKRGLYFNFATFMGQKLTKFAIFLHDNMHEKSFWLLILL